MKEKFKICLSVFAAFFKLGLFTFGGGYAMIPLLQDEFVNKRKWIEENELVDMITVSESTPGPVAINCATYIGYSRGGVAGSVFATLGVVTPPFIIIFLISLFFDKFMESIFQEYLERSIKTYLRGDSGFSSQNFMKPVRVMAVSY